MGKKQHQKDKMYLTCSEWSTLYGGKKYVAPGSDFQRLEFDRCCLSMQPYEVPMCCNDGYIFDLECILPFLKQFKVHPATGEKLDYKSLVKLKFYKDVNGHYHCPVLFKTFTNNSHMVAIKTTGNVFSYEAVEQLNLKTKNFKDLLTSEPFTRTDIIVLQDPNNLEKFNVSKFYHVQKNLRVVDVDEEKAKKDGTFYLNTINHETKLALQELKETYKEPEKPKEEQKKKADSINAAHFSTGRVAAAFTSTVMEPVLEHESAIISDNQVLYSRIKKKSYLRITTNLGNLNLELHSDKIPKTCHNFILLCKKGYYDKTVFHRSIKYFMIQGGDPTGTGKGGDSAWGGTFADEIKPNLVHKGRGVVSMANSGPDTNKSQFFITFNSCEHLNGKHTVFGRLVGGMETLSAMEKIETDNKDRPIEDIVIERVAIFVDPYQEAEDEVAKEREEMKRKLDEEVLEAAKRARSGPPKQCRQGVGKYIPVASSEKESKKPESEPGPSTSKKAKTGGFGDFSSW